MRIVLASLVAVSLVGGSLAGSPFQQAPAPAMSVDDVIKAVRADLQSARADVIAKNVSLTSEQAAKFWPVYEKYQKEQNGIMEEQMKGLHQYVTNFDKLDDVGALGLMKAHLDRDQRMVTLRQKWLAEFQKVLPTKLAVRVIQIDRRLSLAYQMQVAAEIPLVQ